MRRLFVATTLAALILPAAPAFAQRATAAYAIRSTSMRAGPDIDYPVVRRVHRNARVTVYGCLRDRSWCDADYRSDRGWIRGRDLVATYGGRRQEISSYPGIFVLTFLFGNYWDSHYRGRSFYRERPQWERRYYDNYQPNWGPRPVTPPVYRQSIQPSRPGTVRRPQPVEPQFRPQPQRQPQPQPQPQLRSQPQPRAMGGRGAPPRVAPVPANPPAARVKRGNPTPQSTTGQRGRGKKGEGPKQ